MNDQRSHIRDHFTTLQLTLLSIIVALVLENLLGAFWDRETPGVVDLTTVLWWLQVGLVLLSALSAWAGFALTLTSRSRRANFVDVLAPFALLITLNLAIGVLHPGSLSAYLLAIGSASLIAGFMLLSDVRASSLEPSVEATGLEGPESAMKLQLSLGACYFIGVVLLWFGIIETLGGCIILTLACIGQSYGLYRTIQGWQIAT
ncbi:MAG: hypothetical protein O7F71_07885 [Gammaproteobacteria bacterium]|nr:hypothetical protein [Gammaproteobacteria bacterium]